MLAHSYTHSTLPANRNVARRVCARTVPVCAAAPLRQQQQQCSIQGQQEVEFEAVSPSVGASSRRQALAGLASGLALLSVAQPALAGPAEGLVGWWKSRQSANGGAKILAPIKVAQQRLESAKALLPTGPEGATGSVTAWTDALQAVRASSLNCYIFQALPDDTIETKASLATQAFGLSDPCTFRIIVKNVTSLSAPEVREEGYTLLGKLIAAYEKLDADIVDAGAGSSMAADSVAEQLSTTITLLNELEVFVKKVLGV